MFSYIFSKFSQAPSDKSKESSQSFEKFYDNKGKSFYLTVGAPICSNDFNPKENKKGNTTYI